MPNLSCTLHPGGRVRRYRTHGPNGPGVYPQCLPADGGRPHLLTWEEAVGPARVAALDGEAVARAAASAVARLSPSEVAVLCSAARGQTTLESANELGKGPETVKTQRAHVILKLGARNIAHAVAITSGGGILTLDDSKSAAPARQAA
jgi:DNA-binding CsgD family transcriptional regulator